MKDTVNTVHHKNWLDNTLADKSVNLLIADPPYYKVKGEFDFIWKTFADYLVDVEKWAIECKRVLADNGTLLWYGDAKNIAYAQIIFDKYFNLESNITLHIFDRQTNKIPPEEARSFISTSERVLMYSNEINKTGLQEIQNNQTLYKPIRDYFLEQKKNCNYTFKQINEICFNSASNGGGMASNILTSYKDGWSFPTKEKYEALQKIDICPKPYEDLRNEYEDLRNEYEDLRNEYEDLRRPFNPTEQYKMDVLRISQEGHITGKYDHDTVKPEKLTSMFILTCSRKGDTVAVPFTGSGTECAISARYQRPFYGYEIEAKHVKTATNRIKPELMQGVLF